MRFLKQTLIFVHRWLGVVLCLLFLLWFPTGFVLMYWDYPSISPADRLAHTAPLDPATIRVSAADAAAKAEIQPGGSIRLTTFDGRPVYRFGGPESAVVYADTGDEQVEVSQEQVAHIATAWSGHPVKDARVESVDVADQWTLQNRIRDLQPLWKFSWPDGQQVYISQANGDIIQYTTRSSRLGAYLGAIPHWLYVVPLRRNGPLWSRVVIWSSAIAACSAMLGLLIGAVTWAFSGLLSMEPFPQPGSNGGGGPRRSAQTVAQALRGRAPLAAFAGKDPRAALAQMAGLNVKELEFASFAGEPAYFATISPGDTRIVPVSGEPRTTLEIPRVVDIVTRVTQSFGGAKVSVLDQYDRYYLDRKRKAPLPVVLVELNDVEHTRFYLDPKSGRAVGGYGTSSFMDRWLYHGLHSMNFPWLYNNRPAWDIVVIACMLCGTALSVTSLVLAWQVIGRKLRLLDA